MPKKSLTSNLKNVSVTSSGDELRTSRNDVAAAKENEMKTETKKVKNDTSNYVTDFKAGMSVEDIATKYGVTPQSIIVGLKKHGENPTRRGRTATSLKREDVIRALNIGPRLYDASVKLDVSMPTLNKVIAGFKIRREVKYS